MSEEAPAVEAVQVAPAQEPSQPEKEVKQPEAPQGEESPKAEPSELDRIKESYEKRIARQTAANRTTQRQFEEERKAREAVEKRLAEIEAKTNPLASKPSRDDFDTEDEYIDAVADWKLSQRESDKAKQEAQPKPEQIAEQLLKQKEAETAFRQQEETFRKENPDYDKATQVVNGLLKYVDPNHPSTQAFSTTLLNAPNPPALIHYLGTHPDVAIAMMNKSAFEIQDQLGVIIDQLDAPKPQSKPEPLPEPPTPINTSSKGKTTEPSGKALRKQYGLI